MQTTYAYAVLVSLLLSVSSFAEVLQIKNLESFESNVISSPTCVLGLFLDLGKEGGDPLPSDLDLSQFEDLQALVPGVKLVLINYNVKEVANEYNVRRRKASEGRWKSFVWGTRSRAADQVTDFEGAIELSAAVNAMVADKPSDAKGIKLRSILALGSEPEPEADL